MQKRVHPVLVVLVLVIVLAVAAMVYSRRLQTPEPISVGQQRGGMGETRGRGRMAGPGRQPQTSPELGMQFRPNADPRGMRVLGIQSGSPLARLGLQAGDVVTSCNGHTSGIRDELVSAVKGQQSVTLVVDRGGRSLAMRGTLGAGGPGASGQQSEGGRAGGRTGSGPAGRTRR